MTINEFYFSYIFISFFSINFLLLLNEAKSERIRFPITFLIVIFLSLFFGARSSEIGTDTLNYIGFFRSDDEIYGIREPLFYFFKILDMIFWFENFSISLIIISIIINLVFLFSFRKFTRNYPGVFAIFATSFLYINININIIRQGLAMAIIAFAIIFSIKKYKVSYVLYVLSSITHYSAFIICLVALSFNRWRNEFYKRIIPFFIFFVALYYIELKNLLRPFIEYSSAISNAYWILTWNVGREWSFKHIYYLIGILVIFSVILERGKSSDEKSKNRKDVVLLLCFGFFSAMIFKSDEMFADRIFYYFVFLVPIIIYNIKDSISKNYLTFPIILIGSNIWLIKTLLFQFPGWFIPPYESLS